MRNNKGFSLVELIVVIAIMAILAAIAIPTFAHFITKANEASDDELLHNINYIFEAACLENGVDINDVTNATITYSKDENVPIALQSVTVNGVVDQALSAKIVASFKTHFADMKNEKFKIIENIAFDSTKHVFVDAKDVANIYTDIFASISNIDDLADALKNSTFGDIGAQGLMDKLNTVTNLSAALAGKNEKFFGALSNDMDGLAKAMGYANASDAKFQEAYTAMVNRKAAELNVSYDEAQNYILSNYAVLQAAQNTTKDADTLLSDLKSADTVETAKNLLGSSDADNSKEGMSQAAMMYAMYTAYANQMPESTDEQKAAKNAALANTEDPAKLVVAIEEQGFKDYLNTPQAKEDMNGYLAALDIINQGTKGNAEATADLLENGYTDPELAAAMNGLLGK